MEPCSITPEPVPSALVLYNPRFSQYTEDRAMDNPDLTLTLSRIHSLWLVSAGFLATYVLYYRLKSTRNKADVYELGGFSIATAWPFFNKRFDFIRNNFKKTGEALYQFRVLQHRVVAISGEEGRKIFFNDKHLDFTEGYKILMGGAPRLEDVNVEQEKISEESTFNKHLLLLLHKNRLSDMLPVLFEDVHRRTLEWGNEGKINPFKDVYNLVFQMTVRMATCHELAMDPAGIARLASLYWTLEKSATPAALLLPWFPGAAKKAKQRATQELYNLINKYVDLRRSASVPNSDAIDVLISEGLNNRNIVGFVMGVIFAGVINTGITSCWVLLFLAAHPEWKEKVSKEIFGLIAEHTNTTSLDPLHKRLSGIPISAWENSMPATEAVLRETLRMVQNGTLLRRNVVQDMPIADKIVGRGAFLAYNIADVHLNPSIYMDPQRFDPDRYAEGREEDKKSPLSFVAWGAGRHPCSGMKVAKLEMKMILALFLAGYDYELVDESGKFPDPFPQPDRNDIQQARPLGKPCYLKYKRIVE